jgi:murein L,D-transpeptidase YcbB/YkuD
MRFSHKYLRWIFCISFSFFSGCSYFTNHTAKQPEQVSWPLAFDAGSIVQKQLVADALVKKFYQSNGHQLVWVDTSALRSAADSMIAIIRSADQYGLIPDDYHLNEIDKLLGSINSLTQAVELDILLTDSFFALRHHLKYGRLEKKTLSRIDISGITNTEGFSVLDRAFSNNTFRKELEFVEPRSEMYAILKSTLYSLKHINANDSVALLKKNQLIANLERWRWEDARGKDQSICVNIPSCMLRVYEKDSLVLQSNVIIGKPETPTPEIKSAITSFIIYPYWHVPKSIVKEILPLIQQDTSYLIKHNYDVLNKRGDIVRASAIDWPSFTEENFPFILRQREGSENTMGIIKFIFNNNYGVYLHDTNARKMFSRTDRALSHGCIRVQKAVALAHYLVKDDDIYVSPEDLDQYLTLQHRLKIDLVKPIPLYLQYFTCEVNNNKVVFYNDIYGKDKAITEALYKNKIPPI